MKERIKGVLLSGEEIQEAVGRLGSSINEDYKGKKLTVLIILKGSMVFASDLMRRLELPVELEFMRVSSYGKGSVSSGEINVLLDMDVDIKDRDVLIVEDIIDSGNTLYKLKKMLAKREPKSLKICTLLSKPSRREVDIEADYTGIVIEDEFVVGYGLDYAERYRNLPYIGILELTEN